jgi:hypothetical protein
MMTAISMGDDVRLCGTCTGSWRLRSDFQIHSERGLEREASENNESLDSQLELVVAKSLEVVEMTDWCHRTIQKRVYVLCHLAAATVESTYTYKYNGSTAPLTTKSVVAPHSGALSRNWIRSVGSKHKPLDILVF